MSCSKRFSSREKIDSSQFSVVKKSGSKEPFSREKILMSMVKSFGKRPITEQKLEKAVDEIVQQIHKNGKPEIGSSLVGNLVLEKLEKLDLVAHIRFASVFKEFNSFETFKQQLEDWEKR